MPFLHLSLAVFKSCLNQTCGRKMFSKLSESWFPYGLIKPTLFHLKQTCILNRAFYIHRIKRRQRSPCSDFMPAKNTKFIASPVFSLAFDHLDLLKVHLPFTFLRGRSLKCIERSTDFVAAFLSDKYKCSIKYTTWLWWNKVNFTSTIGNLLSLNFKLILWPWF